MSKPAILDIGFSYKAQNLWCLPCALEQMSLEELQSNLDIPYLDREGTDDWNLTPRELLQEREQQRGHWMKVLNANMRYPIEIYRHQETWIILDGVHRFVRAMSQGHTLISVRKIPKEMLRPKRIAIIGISGVGKSWLARRLSQKLGLPIVHYDTLCWDRNWAEVSEAEVKKRILSALATDVWILEGYINPAARERLEAADIVLYLDYSGWRAAWGGFKRWWQHCNTPRPELAEGCEDSWSWERFRIMWTRDERREIETEIKTFLHKVLRFLSPNELEQYIKSLD